MADIFVPSQAAVAWDAATLCRREDTNPPCRRQLLVLYGSGPTTVEPPGEQRMASLKSATHMSSIITAKPDPPSQALTSPHLPGYTGIPETPGTGPAARRRW